jgi:hypothetical protein
MHAEQEKMRQLDTNKHDRCRLLHLFVDPRLRQAWDDTTRAFKRKDFEDENFAPYREIAGAFNDYENYDFPNAIMLYDDRMEPLNRAR